MNNFSVKNQYCDADTGNWYETVFMGSKTCNDGANNKPRWMNHRRGTERKLTFTTDSCVGGLTLESCSFEPCNEASDEKRVTYRFLDERDNPKILKHTLLRDTADPVV